MGPIKSCYIIAGLVFLAVAVAAYLMGRRAAFLSVQEATARQNKLLSDAVGTG